MIRYGPHTGTPRIHSAHNIALIAGVADTA